MNRNSPREGRDRLRPDGFSLGEMLIASAITAIVAAVILTALVGLSRTFKATEQYATAQAGQARLLGYIGRDLRKLSGTGAILSPAIVTGTFMPLGSGPLTSNTLRLLVPCYYASGIGGAPNPFVYVSGSTLASGSLGYGPSTQITTGTISYYKAFDPHTNSMCYFRAESEGLSSGTSTVVDKAEGMLLELCRSGTATPACYSVRVRFSPAFKAKNAAAVEPGPTPNGAEIIATDWVHLRAK